jgi:uncharacterized protein YgiB involved in biofilm formation
MTKESSDDTADLRDYGLAIFLIVLGVAAVVLVVAALWHREPDTALVLATHHDCLRSFDADQCEAIVQAALAIHARTAPGFMAQNTCELSFGMGACRQVTQGTGMGAVFTPDIAVILASRDGDNDEDSLLPLYFGPNRDAGSRVDGRRIYYHGLAVGVLSEVKFGGAEISRVVDLSGKPMTSAVVKGLRQR